MVILVVTAHPDDAEFGAAGSVAKWAAEGNKVIYVVCTNGDKGSSDPSMTSERLARIRQQEQRDAARVLKVKEVIFLGHPDGGLEDTPAFRGELVRLIRQYQPEMVVTADPHRRYVWHRDHRISSRVTLDAVFPYARDHLFYPEHLALGLTPHKVRQLYLWGSEEPNTFIDISQTFSLKMAALRCHRSQLRDLSVEGLEQRLRASASQTGQSQGLALAEAFHKIEITR